jgi:hypothetical protein
MNKIVIKSLIALYVLGFSMLPVFGAIGDGPAGGTFTETVDDTYVPIDGGIVSVTGLAIGYGLKQRKKKRMVKSMRKD